jgi:DNA-binding IclR family transcriptional regulator
MIQVINRALDILELLAQRKDKDVPLKDIAGKLNLNPGTCANIIKTLVQRNYIVKSESARGYKIGPMFESMNSSGRLYTDLVSVSIKPMLKLVNTVKESAILAILEGRMRRIIHETTASNELQALSKAEKDALNSSTGRLMIAYMQSKELKVFLKKYKLLPNEYWPGIKDLDSLQLALNKIREDGFCKQTSLTHITGYAVPVFLNEKVIASLGVYLPEFRNNAEIEEKIINVLIETSNHISKALEKFT